MGKNEENKERFEKSLKTQIAEQMDIDESYILNLSVSKGMYRL